MNQKPSAKRTKANAKASPVTWAQKQKISELAGRCGMQVEQEWDNTTFEEAQALIRALRDPTLSRRGNFDLTDRKTILQNKSMTVLEQTMLNTNQRRIGDPFLWLERKPMYDGTDTADSYLPAPGRPNAHATVHTDTPQGRELSGAVLPGTGPQGVAGDTQGPDGAVGAKQALGAEPEAGGPHGSSDKAH